MIYYVVCLFICPTNSKPKHVNEHHKYMCLLMRLYDCLIIQQSNMTCDEMYFVYGVCASF